MDNKDFPLIPGLDDESVANAVAEFGSTVLDQECANLVITRTLSSPPRNRVIFDNLLKDRTVIFQYDVILADDAVTISKAIQKYHKYGHRILKKIMKRCKEFSLKTIKLQIASCDLVLLHSSLPSENDIVIINSETKCSLHFEIHLHPE